MEKEDFLRIAGRRFSSRLLMGSARFPDKKTMQEAIFESGATIVTVAMRRMPLNQEEGILSFIPPASFLLPNTAGCFTAKEAVFTAELAREALKTNWIKLEVIGDSKTLLPDGEELLKAAEELARKNFVVLPYCTDDLILCRKLIDVGCAAVMPLASPIGSGMGILNPYNLQILREEISHPIIVDAGIGTASDAAIAMELGADGILVNTAIACAHHPLFMARAMKLACAAGRLAYLSGRISKKRYASASSPEEEVLTL